MKIRFFLALLAIGLALPFHGMASEIGAFFTQVNTYGYVEGPEQGKRFLVRARQAVTVLDVTTDFQNRRWLKISFPKISTRLSGEGWTPLAPHEILNNATQMVEVYEKHMEERDNTLAFVQVRASDLKLLNITHPSTKYPNIVWQKVSYAAKAPVNLWVRDGAGIYRSGKTVAYLSRVYADMVSRNIQKDKQTRLLSGVVRVGDSQAEVEWALGKPLRVREESTGSAKKIIWQYAATTVRFDNLLVEKIN